MTLSQITKDVADIIVKRAELGKNYGVILVPEGLVEFIPEMGALISEINEILSKEFSGNLQKYVLDHLSFASKALFQFLPSSISEQLLLDRDPHGNVQVSKIDTEKLLILLLQQELEVRSTDGVYNGKFNPQSHFFGYEGRCALPSNFDSSYCYALGLNAAVLLREGVNGYMSCVKNLTDRDPRNWTAAGCPLPTMMGMERRKGKDKPVISKALVELDGGMFKAYEAVRDKWAYLDCYVSIGPIQFSGPGSDEINFMVKAPEIEQLLAETAEIEEKEKAGNWHIKTAHQLNNLSTARTQDVSVIPKMFETKGTDVTAIKRGRATTALVGQKLEQQLPNVCKDESANYFLEINDELLTNKKFSIDDERINGFNNEQLAKDRDPVQKIGLVFMGKQAPGG
jgi:hypothetical protein